MNCSGVQNKCRMPAGVNKHCHTLKHEPLPHTIQFPHYGSISFLGSIARNSNFWRRCEQTAKDLQIENQAREYHSLSAPLPNSQPHIKLFRATFQTGMKLQTNTTVSGISDLCKASVAYISKKLKNNVWMSALFTSPSISNSSLETVRIKNAIRKRNAIRPSLWYHEQA